MRQNRLSIFGIGLLAALAAPPARGQGPVITEFLADSDGSILDADGAESDWIEIQNRAVEAVDLLGWALTDDPGSLLKWRFPRVVLAPGAYLVVFASGKDRAIAGSELHTNFKLAAEGEYLALVEPGGSTIASRFAPYPPQRPGFSFGVGRKVIEPALVGPGSPARVHVPADGGLGLSFTGGAEPFDDSAWLPATLGVGYPGSGGPPPPQPAAYYGLDGTAQDTAGDGHHGEIRGGAGFSADVPAGLGGGKSLRLDGVDDYVSAPLDVSEGPYSLSLWFKADAGGRGIFAVVDGDLGANGHDRHLYLNGGDIASRVWSDETITSSGKFFADRRWHHAAHVVGGWTGGQRIYVDGQLAASGAKAASDFNWQERIDIGFSNDAAAPFFAGLIDDVSLWDVALTEAQIRALAAGAHPLALSGYAPWIATDLGPALRGASASAYVRIPFELPPSLEFNSLELRIRYDDGFVAYLNGVEVARRNSPDDAGFDARSLSDRPASAAIRPEEIDLGAFRWALRSGPDVLAFHALNDRPDGSDFLLEPELAAALDGEGRFLSPPTPGEANAAGVIGFVADTVFSFERGFSKDPFDVEIATQTDGAVIYTTKDGSAPAPGNLAAVRFTAPLRITKTTTLRAAAFKDDHQPSKVATQTYIFPAQVARQPDLPAGLPSAWAGGYPADYGVDPDVVNRTLPGYGFEDALRAIPTLSLVTGPQDLFSAASGVYSNSQGRGPAWERAASIELIRQDRAGGFQADCGIRLHGNSSRDHWFTPKHPIRLYFRSAYGQKKLKYQLFEDSKVSSFDELLLRGCSTDSWPVVDGGYVLGVQRWAAVHATYLRDQWMRDAQIEMGRPSCSGTYVHLFLNGLYWGLYNLAERPVDSFCASHLGGSKEEYDVLKDFTELESGNPDAWNAMVSLAAAGLGNDAAYQRIQGRNPDGTPNPAYPVYLDVEGLIDYMILHIASGAEDWPHHNWWGARRRGPESTGFKFFVWDQEISIDSLVRTHTLFETPFEQPAPNPSPSWLSGQCMANPSYRRAFGDRVQKHLFDGGLLSPEANSQRWLRRQREIDHAIVGESARWGDSKRTVPYRREVEWLAEMNWMRDRYWPEVQPIAVERFRRVSLYPPVDAPWFEIGGERRSGGSIAAGDLLALKVETAAGITFTLDGKDPMDPAAGAYTGPILLDRTTVVKARAREGGQWSALAEAIFTNPLDIPLRVSEVSYQPEPREGEGDPDEYEFLELVNAGGAALSLEGIRLEGGVELDLGASEVGSLGPGERILLVEDRDAFAARYGLVGMAIAGQYTGKLSNEGERLLLKGPLGETLLDFRYDSAWYPETRGGGRTLVIADEGGPPDGWGLAESWRPSAWEGGSPGQPEPDAGGGGLRLPGDSNGDAVLDLSDAISLLFRLFGGGPAEPPCLGSLETGGNLELLDSSGDARVDISDVVYVLQHLFQGGPAPIKGTACVRIGGCPPACRP